MVFLVKVCEMRAIEMALPGETEILRILKENQGWVCASRVWHRALSMHKINDAQRNALHHVSRKLQELVRTGDVQSIWMAKLPMCERDLVRLDGQLVDPADLDKIKPYFDRSPLAVVLAHAFRISSRGNDRITPKIYKPMLASTVLMATTACSSFHQNNLPERQIGRIPTQVVQSKDSSGNTYWTTCDVNCPLPTPKMVEPVQLRSIPVAEIPAIPREMSLAVIFKFNSAEISSVDRIQLAKLLGETDSIKSVVVVGRADPLGSYVRNEKLALQRANALKRILVASGVDERRIEMQTAVEISKINADAVVGSSPSRLAQQSRRADLQVRRVIVSLNSSRN